MKFKQIEILFQQMSCSLRLPLRQPRPLPVTTPLTCLLSAEAARVVLCLSVSLYSLSPSLPSAVVCFVCHKSRVFCVHFGGKLQVVVRRFVALFNLDKLKTMPHLPHATDTLATWGTEREREGELPTLCSSCKRQGSRLPPLPSPALVYCSRAQQAASAGNAPPSTSRPLWHMQHAPCATYVQSMRQQLKRKTKKENAMGQLATCHLPHTLGQAALHSCCTVVCLAIESALSYLPKGGKGARGRGRLNRWAPLATRLSLGRQF